MVGLTDLWIPILVSTVVVFLVSWILHMFVPHHRNDYGKLPNEADVLAAMRKAGVSQGNYMFPCPANMKDMASPEMQEKYEQGPVGFANIMPNGPFPWGKGLAQWFVFCLVIGVFVAYLTGRTLGPGTEYLMVFRVAGAVAFLGYAGAQPLDSIWKGQKWSTTIKHVIDGLLYALVTAGCFGWFWPGD